MQNKRASLSFTVAALSISLLTMSCGKSNSSVSALPSFPPTKPGPPELPYCTTPIVYSNPVTISGTAGFQYREPFDHGGNNRGLGAVKGLNAMSDPPKPVRYAEVRVLNATGGVVQCATTNASGAFSFNLQQGGGSYTVQINSRSNNSELVATVFDSPDTKTFYSITTTVTPSSAQNIGALVASATGDVKAGAFNILDQLYRSNAYLRSEVGTCGLAGCPDFTVTPKIEVFWRRGFNPGTYYNMGPLSFYLPGYGRLFILGGVNGDTDSSDTDHFDNSVIIHEFGHFLEDRMLKSDSQGGAHNGNATIDPRLAWSEGWGNFLQAAVQNQPLYIDTIGNVDGPVTKAAFYVNLETASSDNDTPVAGPGGIDGEGNYREFSVTRFLWDVIDSNNDGENISGGFKQIWATLNKTTNGWLSPKARFRSVGFFHLIQSQLTGTIDLSSIRTLEKQIVNRKTADYPDANPTVVRYAEYVTPQSGCTGFNYPISPVNDGKRDMYRNNGFFHYYNSSALSNVRFRVQYVDATALVDLDFYIYNSSARYGNSSDLMGASALDPTSGVGTQKTESITISQLPVGDYILNVNAYNPSNSGGTANYRIQRSTDGGSTWTSLCLSEMPL